MGVQDRALKLYPAGMPSSKAGQDSQSLISLTNIMLSFSNLPWSSQFYLTLYLQEIGKRKKNKTKTKGKEIVKGIGSSTR